jgi:hypothetical protein
MSTTPYVGAAIARKEDKRFLVGADVGRGAHRASSLFSFVAAAHERTARTMLW